MSEALSLGLEHFVFFDDNPAEREQVRQALPMVAVIDVPPDPADYIGAIGASLLFEAVTLTDDDRARTDRYHAEQARRSVRDQATDLDAYLASLQMQGRVRPIEEADMQRVVQLIGKTNQFNLTTRRHSEADVRALIDGGGRGWTLHLADRFGDYGLVGVVLGVQQDTGLRLDTFLMSCRVIGRTAEQFLMAQILAQIPEDLTEIIGEYLPTRKNGMVASMYPSMGFVEEPQRRSPTDASVGPSGGSPTQRSPPIGEAVDGPGEAQRFRLALPAVPPATAVRSA